MNISSEAAAYLAARRSQPKESIQPRPVGAIVEASESQYEIWLHNESANGVPIYNESFALNVNGKLNVPALENALNYVVNRHEAWRTTFQWRDDRLMQIIAPRVNIRLTPEYLGRISPMQRGQRSLELAHSDRRQPFDTTKGPLFRMRLLQLDEQQYRLLIVVHHLICDGISINEVFLPDLSLCYGAYSTGNEPTLPPLRFQYPDYVLWQRSQLTKSKLAARLEYWQTTLCGNLPSMAPLLDRPCPPKRSYEGGAEPFSISLTLTEDLRRLASDCDATLFMVLLAAFNALIYGESGLCDQLIGSVTSGRAGVGTQRLLGNFVNAIAFRVTFLSKASFRRLLMQVRDVTLNALSNELPFRILIDHFAKEGKSVINPFNQIMFSFEPMATNILPDWHYTKTDGQDLSKFDLSLQISEQIDGLTGRFAYRCDVFQTSRMAKITKNWLALLPLIVSEPEQSILSLVQGLSSISHQISSNNQVELC